MGWLSRRRRRDEREAEKWRAHQWDGWYPAPLPRGRLGRLIRRGKV